MNIHNVINGASLHICKMLHKACVHHSYFIMVAMHVYNAATYVLYQTIPEKVKECTV